MKRRAELFLLAAAPRSSEVPSPGVIPAYHQATNSAEALTTRQPSRRKNSPDLVWAIVTESR